MGIFADLNARFGNATFPPNKEIADRWEWVDYWSGLRDGKEEFVRNEAYRRGLGGKVREAYIAQPVPRAISQASANLLFGEDPEIRVASGNNDDQQRLNQIVSENKLLAQCRAAAVTTSSEGGVYVKVAVDPSTPRGRKVPLIQFITETRVIPRFEAFSELTAASIITSWEEGNRTLRLFETHQPGVISYELFAGGSTSLGTQIDLSNNERTAGLDPEIETGVPDLLVSYIPNSLNTDSPFGVSDYANGVDDLFFAFNDATSIAHKATQSGVPLTVLPRELLDENQNLNHEQSIIAVNKLADTLGEGDIGKMIQTIQHTAQQDKFMAYAQELLDLIFIFSGLSPQSVGRSVDGGAYSGIAIKLKMASTLSTAAGKAAFFEDALSESLGLAALLDQEAVGAGDLVKPGYTWNEDTNVSVRLRDGLPDDEMELAQIVQTLRSAGSISIEQAIRRANPHFSEDQIQAELESIRQDAVAETQAITGSLPGISAADLVGNLNEPAPPADQQQ